ncbi:MAG: 23S rRNA (uracil(1939)-C(5))-methyltransferase RlmD [Trichlorobacter sp.]|jgi:23S rRNA (uracil1939-C5)-methyltransferase
MKLSEVTIERLAFGGSGVGRIDGKVCFVPFSAPGDRLTVRVVKEHRSWLEAELVEVREASPLRVQPVCSAFGQCGGCDWQHLHYAAQAEAKRSILLETLQRVGKLVEPPVGQTVMAPAAYGYRARAQFKLHQTADGLKAGFYRRGSRSVIDLPQGCPVVTPAINSALARLRQQLESLPDADSVSQISLEEGEQGCHAMLRYTGSDPQRLAAHLRQQAGLLNLAGLFLQSGRKENLTPVFGDERITYRVPSGEAGELLLGYGIGGFSQVNRQQNQAMIRLVHQLLHPAPKDRLLDLYCGNGNLSLPLAEQCSEVVGIEGYQPSIASAVDNSRQVRVNNSTFRCADAAAELQRLITQQQRFGAVLLDPPRSGAPDLVRTLPLLGASRIIYVSCDPGTLARDLASLTGSGNYRLESALPLDMFPQTGHLETVACLTRT